MSLKKVGAPLIKAPVMEALQVYSSPEDKANKMCSPYICLLWLPIQLRSIKHELKSQFV